jgi:hypothetical protein
VWNRTPPHRVHPLYTEEMGAIVTSTSAKTEARRQARARLAAKVAERRRREQAELEAITEFEAALTRRDRAETEMAAAVAGLLDLGNSVADAASLTEQPETEIRRLVKLAAQSASAAADNGAVASRNRLAGLPSRHRDSDGQNSLALGSDTTGAAMADADETSPEHATTADAEGTSAEPGVAL